MSAAEVFRAGALRVRYPGSAQPALGDVSMRVRRGELYAVSGPNGSGKSTLARALLGLLRPETGLALFEGRPAAAWDRRELARRVGVVPQSEELVFPLTVRALVCMGRYPHLGPWRAEGAADRDAVARALDACDVAQLGDRLVSRLSGGERQRARIARALAQEPDTLVLDEPTAALDIAHEMAIFELLAGLRAARGVTVLLVTHNINLAARYADRMLLLERGRALAEGSPAMVVTRTLIERSYHWPVNVFAHAGPGEDAGAPQLTPLARQRQPDAPA
ncbi:MAG: ABC transporter ATP-binding protein [Gemmatimonadetes bacterium]|nr:ABC transporter ATP-binding protein [Gemmatimonadota bacterium]